MIPSWKRLGKIGQGRLYLFLFSSVGRAGGTNYTGAIPIKADEKRSLKLYKFHIFLLSSVGRANEAKCKENRLVFLYKNEV